jgi:hypothetical protein
MKILAKIKKNRCKKILDLVEEVFKENINFLSNLSTKQIEVTNIERQILFFDTISFPIIISKKGIKRSAQKALFEIKGGLEYFLKNNYIVSFRFIDHGPPNPSSGGIYIDYDYYCQKVSEDKKLQLELKLYTRKPIGFRIRGFRTYGLFETIFQITLPVLRWRASIESCFYVEKNDNRNS